MVEAIETGKKVTSFDKQLTLDIHLSFDDLQGIDVRSLKVYYLDEQSLRWLPIESQFDPNEGKLTAKLDHFSVYSTQANPLENGPGRIMSHLVNLHSGTAMYEYPIDLLPGPGGFQPEIKLSYNSGSVDEMKNKRDVGSWVGIGWSLDLGRISLDLSTHSYNLELNGVSYKLITWNGVDYFTSPDEYMRITRSGNTWIVIDRSGNRFRFGGTTDSEQYLPYSTYYRWDISQIEDTNGNTANITYTQDTQGTSPMDWVRSAYPTQMSYGSTRVYFSSSYDETTADGNVRYDNPISDDAVPAPMIMENRKLDSIEIKVIDGTEKLVRKYAFNYYGRTGAPSDESYNRTSSEDYGGISYAGKFKLYSITEIGSDGSSSLPVTTFVYQDKTVFRQTDEGNYTGNPGNPASLTWPWLTRIDNGYGGSVVFSYNQKPGSSPEDIWTRQVVVEKTIDPGIGEVQTTGYSYTGDPQYSGTGWDQKYGGFTQVTVTDAEDNYIEHKFHTSGNLSGKEYETNWYDSTDTLLKSIENTWESVSVGTPQSEGTYLGANSGGTLSSPWGVSVAVDGSVYVASTGTNRIVKYDANMTYQSSPFDSVAISSPRDLAISADGYIYVTSGNYVYKYDMGGNLITQFGNTYLSSPYGIAVSSEGALGNNIYVASAGNKKVVKFTTDGTYVSQYSTSYTPYDVALSPNADKVYVTAAYQSAPFSCNPYTCYAWSDCCTMESPGTICDYDCDWCYCCWTAGYPPYPEICGYDECCGECCEPIPCPPECAGCWLSGTCNETCYYIYDFLITLFAPTMGFITQGYYNSGSNNPYGVWVAGDGSIYVSMPSVIKNLSTGTTFGSGQVSAPKGISTGETEILAVTGNTVKRFTRARENYIVRLTEVEETTFGSPANKIVNTEYVYDDYGNVIAEKYYGDTANNTDDRTLWRTFNLNLGDNILNKPASERLYTTIMASDSLGENLRSQTCYYYDSNTGLYDEPEEGNLTEVVQSRSGSDNISRYYTYDSYGNISTETDPNGNTISYTYDGSHTFLVSKTLPLVGTEYYGYTWGWSESGEYGVMSVNTTDINNQQSITYYDRFDRLYRTVLPGDSFVSPSTEILYTGWGTPGDQYIETKTKIATGNYTWQKQYFDGLGRVIQTHSPGETGYTVLSGTKVFNNRGMTENNYVTQVVQTAVLDGYANPDSDTNWLSGWANRIEITLDSSKIDSTLTHFPVMLHLSADCGTNSANVTQVFAELGTNYNKIAVTEGDAQTQLYVEVESWDSNSQEAWLWVSRSGWIIDSSEDTVLYLYYDSTHAANDSYVGLVGSPAGQAVWDSNYRLVDHMEDNPDTSHTADSTDYENDGTKDAANEPQYASGMNGDCQDFDGSDDYIVYADDPSLEPGNAVSVEAIFKTAVYLNAGHIYRHSGDPYHRNGERLYVNTDKTPIFWVYSDAGLYAARKGYTDVADNVYHYVVGTYDTGLPSGNLKIFVDGYQEGSGANVTMPIGYDANQGGYVGKCGIWNRYYFEGDIDEFRLSGIARSAAWIKATYYTCWDELAYYSSGQIDSNPITLDWKYSFIEYDALGRVISVTNPDGTETQHDYSVTWSDFVTNPLGYDTRYYYDAFSKLVSVQETDGGTELYTTGYQYDTLGNLIRVTDARGNITEMDYDWLSRKTDMTDPDMGTWSYEYDDNGNLVSQTDAKNQTVNMTYDYLNRITGKMYPAGSGMTDIAYSYDSGTYGKGQRTGMVDALGTVAYVYDARGRLVTETRTADSIDYTTHYAYDGINRVTSVTYPTGETVNQTYNGRGIPYSLCGSDAEELVLSTVYNGLGSVTEINLGNGLKTTYGYYGTGGTYDTTGGYYGRLWEIKTSPQAGGTALMDMAHSWDANGNLASRYDVREDETEAFGYDFLDRLTSVSGNYSSSYSYDEIGNMIGRNSLSYSYDSTQPHAVDSINGTVYTYDNNGNMVYRGSANQTITWDVENKPVSISENGVPIATFIYDGNGNRVKKTESGETVLYIGNYYEKNFTTGNITTSYYLGSRLVAQKEGTELRYIHQDHLSGTSLMTSDNGSLIGSMMKYMPFGTARSGDVPTDRLFTGQRYDDIGLYYYGARYYDPEIGRFISPDTIIPNPTDPQSFNRYSYCLNNPLKYIDPTGHYTTEEAMSVPGLEWVDTEIVQEVIEGAIDPEPAMPVETDYYWDEGQAANGLLGKGPQVGKAVLKRWTNIVFEGDMVYNQAIKGGSRYFHLDYKGGHFNADIGFLSKFKFNHSTKLLKVFSGLKTVSKAFPYVSLAVDAADLGTSIYNDSMGTGTISYGSESKAATGRIIGGWVGAAAGAAAGAAIGSAVPVIGTVVGGIIGGMIGGFGGGILGGKVPGWLQ